MKNKEKVNAHRLVNVALSNGVLIKSLCCDNCGEMAEKEKKETVKKTVKAKPEVNQALEDYEDVIKDLDSRLKKNPMLKIGAIMSTMQYTDNLRLILKFIAELDKKFTPDDVAIATKIVKK